MASMRKRIWTCTIAAVACFSVAAARPTLASATHRWRSSGPEGGWIRSLAVAPSDPSVVYAGGNGIYRTVDGGARWNEADGGIDGLAVYGVVGDIAVDPQDPSLAYAATGRGLYRTTEGGRHWEDASPVSQSWYSSVAIDPTDHRRIYAGDAGGGIFRSNDGGVMWSRIARGLPPYEVVAIVVDPSDPATIYAGITFGGVFKTTDGGRTWVAVLTNPYAIDDLAVDPAHPQTLYAAEDLFGVWTTRDGGASWRETDRGIHGLRVRALAVDSQDPSTVYAGGGSLSPDHPRGFGIFKSIDAGRSWAPADDGLNDTDLWALSIDPASPSVLYAGTRSFGAFKTIDGAQSWTLAADGIVGAEVHSLGAGPSDPRVIYAGLSMGVSASRTGGRRWVATGRPPAIYRVTAVSVDPVTPGTLYAGTDTSGAYRSADSGNSWREIDDGLQVAGYPVVGVSRIVIDPSQPARVYASVTFTGEANSFDTVYRSDDGGGHWQPANDGLPDGFSGDVPLVLDPSNPSTLFAAVQPDGVYRSTDGGETWAAFGTGLPGDVIGLAIDPADSQQMYASVQFGVYRSVDAGATWTEADGGLPNAQLWNVTFDPVRPDTAYAGGFYYGVYATVDGGLSWTPMNAGLRNKGILALRVDAVGSRLFAGTQGHGVFVLPLG